MLSGCGALSVTSRPSPTPISSGERILQHAQHVPLHDVIYTLNGELKLTADTSGIGPVPPLISMGTGEMSGNPLYYEANLYDISGMKHTHEQIIYVQATQTEYDLNPTEFSDENWHQAQVPESIFWLPKAALDYLQMTNATLVGTEHLDGVTVWHVRGTLKYLLSESGVIDVYLRQDTYLPVETVIHEVSGK